mgnify:FL=1
MNAFQKKAAAQRHFTEVTNKLGFRPDVSLRGMNSYQINRIISDLERNISLDLNNYIKTLIPVETIKVPKNRSKMIRQIKEINPSFKPAKNDTYDQLSRKYPSPNPK